MHIFKNPARILEQMGHDIWIFGRSSDVTKDLLEQYSLNSEVLVEKEPTNIINLCKIQAKYEYKMINKFRKIRPDIVISQSGVAASHAAKLTDAKNILFIDNDHATIENRLSKPFADKIYSPNGFKKHFGKKHEFYDSYDYLAYTHPDYFEPNTEVFKHLNINSDANYVLFRLIAWNAAHDFRAERSTDFKKLIKKFDELGYNILISSEETAPGEFQEFIIDVPPHLFHDLLYYSNLYVGEGAATALEAALLGTPAIYLNELNLGYLTEFENRYGSVKDLHGHSTDDIMKNAKLMLSNDFNANSIRKQVAEEKRDMTKLIVDSVSEVHDR
ncbi:DUF354 domain-containing protein [Halosimplex rubrum]|uniref:DUF354 domain-containing protein n=1 Tax=Halosimplex rubrum TaxID=869889 RepID=A0A7D5NZL6_9EURY|nr:DUF354 domain-containing protein [Halosimplex rubrum]